MNHEDDYVYANRNHLFTDEMITKLTEREIVQAINLLRDKYKLEFLDATYEVEYFMAHNNITRPLTPAMECLVNNDFMIEAAELYTHHYNSSITEANKAVEQFWFTPCNARAALTTLSKFKEEGRLYVKEESAKKADYALKFLTKFIEDNS